MRRGRTISKNPLWMAIACLIGGGIVFWSVISLAEDTDQKLAWLGSEPAFFDGKIYYFGGDGAVAVDADSGRILWEHREIDGQGFETPQIQAPVVTDDVVISVIEKEDESSASLVALDRQTGELTWSVARKGLDPRPVRRGEHLYIYALGDHGDEEDEQEMDLAAAMAASAESTARDSTLQAGAVFAIEIATGQVHRVYEAPTPPPMYGVLDWGRFRIAEPNLILLGGRPRIPPASYSEQCGTGDGTRGERRPREVKAISLDTGAVEWSTRVPSGEVTQLAADEKGIYLGTFDGQVLEFEVESGQMRKLHEFEDDIFHMELAPDHLVVVSFGDHRVLHVIDRDAREVAWSLDYSSKSNDGKRAKLTNPRVIDDGLWIAHWRDEGSVVTVYELSNGEEFASFEAGKRADKPVVAGQRLFFGHRNMWESRSLPDNLRR